MLTAKIFENGRSQAIRLPKEYRFDDSEVKINKIGDIVLLIPINNKWENFEKALKMFSNDFMESGRGDLSADKRELL